MPGGRETPLLHRRGSIAGGSSADQPGLITDQPGRTADQRGPTIDQRGRASISW